MAKEVSDGKQKISAGAEEPQDGAQDQSRPGEYEDVVAATDAPAQPGKLLFQKQIRIVARDMYPPLSLHAVLAPICSVGPGVPGCRKRKSRLKPLAPASPCVRGHDA